MSNPAVIDNSFEISPRLEGLPLITFIGGIVLFIFLLLGYYINPLFFIGSALLIFPLLYINKTVALYIYVLSYAYTLPIYSYRGDFRIDDLFFVVIASIWLMDKALNPDARSSKKMFTRPLLLWLGINGLSIFMIFINYGAFWTFRASYFYIRLVEYVFVYFIVSDMIKNRNTKIMLIRLIWLITVFICFFGLYQYYVLGWERITSTLSESHVQVGVFLQFTFFVLAGHLFISRNIPEKVLVSATLLMMIYVLFLSASRSSIISLIAGVVIFFLFFRRPSFRIIAVVLIVLFIFAGIDFLENLQEYELGDAGFRNLERDLSTMGRLYIWYGTFEMLKQNPSVLIIGAGLSAFKLAVGPYTLLVGGGSGAHNNYLHHLVETGIAGLAVFLYILFVLLRRSLLRSRERIRKDRALYYGYFCGLAALVFSGLSQETFSVQNALTNTLGYFFLVTAVVFADFTKNKDFKSSGF